MNYEREAVVASALASLYASGLAASDGVKGYEVCASCRERPALKTGGDARPVCSRCAELTPEPFRRPAPRVRRNAPCPCHSGRKFKSCCLPGLPGTR
jgi:uncharacterized protein YecA (UPF0149 family)